MGSSMRAGRMSITALAIAAARGLASSTHGAVIDAHDTLAAGLLPRPLALALRTLEHAPGGELLARGVASASAGLVDHVALRTAMIDGMVTDAARAGIEQFVILGAGLDSRAHRLDALARATVYEVDHPDSQRYKRAHSDELAIRARALHYVTADLTLPTLQARLREAGHRHGAPTFWLAEGLFPYLPLPAIERMLQTLAAASAPDSRLAITYVVPDLVWLRRTGPAFRGMLALIGEHLRTPLSAADLKALLHTAGFRLEQDSDTHAWAAALAPDHRRRLIAYERLALAQKP